jgi:hypothetical protein
MSGTTRSSSDELCAHEMLRIREALAFNGDFGAAGFIELRPKAAHTKGAAPRAGISSHGQRNPFLVESESLM